MRGGEESDDSSVVFTGSAPAPPAPPAPSKSIKVMKEAILAASTPDLLERSHVEERYEQALARLEEADRSSSKAPTAASATWSNGYCGRPRGRWPSEARTAGQPRRALARCRWRATRWLPSSATSRSTRFTPKGLPASRRRLSFPRPRGGARPAVPLPSRRDPRHDAEETVVGQLPNRKEWRTPMAVTTPGRICLLQRWCTGLDPHGQHHQL